MIAGGICGPTPLKRHPVKIRTVALSAVLVEIASVFTDAIRADIREPGVSTMRIEDRYATTIWALGFEMSHYATRMPWCIIWP